MSLDYKALVKKYNTPLYVYDFNHFENQFLELKKAFSQAHVVKDELYWKDLKRYSSRQNRKVPLGGLVGKVVVENTSSWWWRWWQMATLVHVGKGTNMGLGKVTFCSY